MMDVRKGLSNAKRSWGPVHPTRRRPSVRGVRTVAVADHDPEFRELDDRIASGKYAVKGSKKEKLSRPARKFLSRDPVGPGRWLAKQLALAGLEWRRNAATRMPEARGDLRELVNQPFFVPLFSLFRAFGPIFRLSFGPQTFVVISDPQMAKQVLLTNAAQYSKGILSEILEFVMGQGLIPADGEVWKSRRRKVVPSLHRRYIERMVAMFGECALHCAGSLRAAAAAGQSVDLENYYSRLGLDIIGIAVFGYDFDSLSKDDPVIKAVYTTLREAEHRSLTPIPYWKLPGAATLIPRQRDNVEALRLINETLSALIAESKALYDAEAASGHAFEDDTRGEFLSARDPSILHFLIASGDEVSSKQLRDDLMTLLIAGHETTAAVLTWTSYLLAEHPSVQERVQAEVDAVIGDAAPSATQLRELRYTTRVVNEAMRLYPQPPVLIRRALHDDVIGGYPVRRGADIFISVWNLHRSPAHWERPSDFWPERPEFGPLDGTIPNEVTTDFAYLPFGGGRRKCIGDQFALFETIVALAVLMRRFTFRLDPEGPDVSMTTGATIHTTNGLQMDLIPREAALTSTDRDEEHPQEAGCASTDSNGAWRSEEMGGREGVGSDGVSVDAPTLVR